MKSLVPKHYKSILMNLSKTVFYLARKWADENHYFLFQFFHIAFVGYNNNEKIKSRF